MKKLFLSAWLMMLSIVAMAQSFIVVDKAGKRTAFDPSKISNVVFQTTPPGFIVNYDGKSFQYLFDESVRSIIGDPNYVFSFPDIVQADADGEEFNIQVDANVEYDVVPSASWITVATELPDVEGVLNYKAAMNPSTEKREGYILLASKDRQLTDTVFVSQAGKEDSRYIDIDWETTKLDSFDPETGVAVVTFAGDVPVMGEYDVVLLPDEIGNYIIRVIEEVTQTADKTVTLKTLQGDMGNLFRDQEFTFELGESSPASVRQRAAGSKPVFRPVKVEVFENGKYVEVYNTQSLARRAPSAQEGLTLDYEGNDVVLESWGNLTYKIKRAKLALTFKGTLDFSFEKRPWYKVWKGHTAKASVMLEGDSETENVTSLACCTSQEMNRQAKDFAEDMLLLKDGAVRQRYTFNVEGVPVQVVLGGDVKCNYSYRCVGQGDVTGGLKVSKHFKYGITCVNDNEDGVYTHEEKPTGQLIYPESHIGSAEYKNSRCMGNLTILPVFNINFYGQYCDTRISPAEWTSLPARSWQVYPETFPDYLAHYTRVCRWSGIHLHMKNVPGWLFDFTYGENFTDNEYYEDVLYDPEFFSLDTPERNLMLDDQQDIEITAYHYDRASGKKYASAGALVEFETTGSGTDEKKQVLVYTDENGKAKMTFKKDNPWEEKVTIRLFRHPTGDKALGVDKYVENYWNSKLLNYKIQCLTPSQEVERDAVDVPVTFLLQKSEGYKTESWANKRVEFIATNGTVSPRFNTTDANGLVKAFFTPTNDAPEGEVIAIVTEDGNTKSWEGRAVAKITIKSGKDPCDTGDDDLNKANLQANTYVVKNTKTGETVTRPYNPDYSEWTKKKDFISFQLNDEEVDAQGNPKTKGMLYGHIPLTMRGVVLALTGQQFENTPGAKVGFGLYDKFYVSTDFMCASGEGGSMITEGEIKPDGKSKILIRKPCNQTTANNSRRAPGDEQEEEYTGEYELLYYLVFTTHAYNPETQQEEEVELEVYGKGTMKMHVPSITYFVLSNDKDWVRVGESTKVTLERYDEEGAVWDWNDVQIVGQSPDYSKARNGEDEGFFSWDAATQTLTSLKSNDNKDVWVYLGLKSNPGVKAPLQFATGEGWKYTTIGTSKEEITCQANNYPSFDMTWLPKDSDDERFDFNSVELDPECNPNNYFTFPAMPYANQGWPLHVNYNCPPGEYNLKIRLKSDYSVNCTLKVTVTE